MTRLEKIKYLEKKGIKINKKASSKRVDAKFKKNKIENNLKNRKRRQKIKNEKIKKQKLKNIKPIKTGFIKCYACHGLFKRSHTIYERLIIKNNGDELNARFCEKCHKEIKARMK